MMESAKRYEVTIAGDSYTIVSDQSKEHVAQAAAMVDALMKEILAKSRSIDTKKVAALTALKIASRLLQKEFEIDGIQQHHDDLVSYIESHLS